MRQLLRTFWLGLFAAALCLPASGPAQQSTGEGLSEFGLSLLNEVQNGAQQLAKQQGRFAGRSIGPQFASATNQLQQFLANFDIAACGTMVTALHLKRQRLAVAAAAARPADPALDKAVDDFGRLISQLQELCDRHVHRIYGNQPTGAGGAGTKGATETPPTEEPPRMSVQERICYNRCRQLYIAFLNAERDYDRAKRSAELIRSRANSLRRAADEADQRARENERRAEEIRRKRERLRRIIENPNRTPKQKSDAAIEYGKIRPLPPGSGPSSDDPAKKAQDAAAEAARSEANAARAEAQANALYDAMIEIYEAWLRCARECAEQARRHDKVTIDPFNIFTGMPKSPPRRPPFYRPAPPPPVAAPRTQSPRPTSQVQQRQQSAFRVDPASARMLALHNAERAAVGVPPLRWDPALQESASAYAAHLARAGRLVHAPRTGRTIERENLSQGMIGWSTDQMVANWINEKRNFVPGLFPNVSRTGNWSDVGHYSQMIWPTTTNVGCGMATGSGYQWLVCRYSPGGNKEGHAVGMRRPL